MVSEGYVYIVFGRALQPCAPTVSSHQPYDNTVLSQTSQPLKFTVFNDSSASKVNFLSAKPDQQRGLIEIGREQKEEYDILNDPWLVKVIQVKTVEGLFAILGLLLYPELNTSQLEVKLDAHLTAAARKGVGEMGEWKVENGVIEYKVMSVMDCADGDAPAKTEAWMRDYFEADVKFWSYQRAPAQPDDEAGLL